MDGALQKALVFYSKTGVNSKKNSAIGELARNVDIAIAQEKSPMDKEKVTQWYH